MNEGRTTNKNKESAGKSDGAATQKAEEAAQAKAEELRTALQSKGEQGKSSLGSLPIDEDKPIKKYFKVGA
jgi:hypothetical protein